MPAQLRIDLRFATEAAPPRVTVSARGTGAHTSLPDHQIPPAVRTAWRACELMWEDQARHAELLGVVAQHGCFTWACARYRDRGDKIADRQLERLRRSATAVILGKQTKRPEAKPYRALIMVMAVLMSGAFSGAAWMKLHAQSASSSPTTSTRR